MVTEERNGYHEELLSQVLAASNSDDWNQAVLEWEIIGWQEDEALKSSCTCGKQHLRYLFTIKNNVNGNVLYPIGSSCIKKIEREDFDEEVRVKEQLFKLLHAIEKNSFISLSSDLFSRKLLLHLYEIGAFKPTTYNDYDPKKDYEFMRDMFNKKNRTQKQERKIKAIILNSIKPFLTKLLRDRDGKLLY